nr:helix-turn-helix transcriptional regulator [Cohnella zeiphila]
MLHRRPMSGYEIKGMFEMPLGFFYETSFGTIYPTLAKLESQGFIAGESVVQSGKPNKNVYTITAAGKARFLEYMESPLEKNVFRSDLMMRLFFAEFVGAGKLIEWLRQEIEDSEREYGSMLDRKQQWEERASGPTICLNIGLRLTEGKIKALKEELAKLQGEDEG